MAEQQPGTSPMAPIRFLKVRFASLFLALVGTLSPGLSQAVVGGKDVTDGEAPWMVALLDQSEAPSQSCLDSGGSEAFCQHYCGGTLISPNWVLTAAHCVDNSLQSLDVLELVLGTTDLNDTSLVTRGVNEKFVNSSYFSDSSYHYDVALLLLDSPTDLSPASVGEQVSFDILEPVENGSGSLDDELSVFGWGVIDDTGGFPALLQRTALDLQPDTACSSVYNYSSIQNYFPTDMLCAAEATPGNIEADDAGDPLPGDPEGEDACKLDSGGPLVYGANGYPEVMGLVSFGDRSNCGDFTRPGVYTRMGSFFGWMEAAASSQAASLQGAPLLGDLALTIGGAASAPAGQNEQVQLTVTNQSQSTSASAVTLDAQIRGVGSVLNNQSGLTCTLSGGTLSCSTASLTAGNSVSVTLELQPGAGDQLGVVEASLAQTAFDDYRAGNDTRRHELVFSDNPAPVLADTTVVTEKLDQGGDIHLFLTVKNRSGVATSGVQITSSTQEDYVFMDSPDGCVAASPFTCIIGDLAAGENATVGLRLHSATTMDGQIDLQLSATGSTFQAGGGGSFDQQATLDVVFLDTPAPALDKSSGETKTFAPASSGGGGVEWLLFVSLSLLPLRRRQVPS